MPESKSRKEFAYKPPPKRAPGPPRLQTWVAPTMVDAARAGARVGRRVLRDPVRVADRALGNWNLLVGLGLIAAGCVTATKWR